MFLTARELGRQRVAQQKNMRCLQLEVLESRRLLATFAVRTLADTGPGSIREAIEQANAAAGPDEIVFTGAATTGTIELVNSQLIVTDAITITGPGADRLTIDAMGSPEKMPGVHRAFLIDDGNSAVDSPASISGLTVTGGFVSGDEAGPARGGGIYSYEPLMITDSVVFGNTALSEGRADGGGIWANELSVSDSEISRNLAAGNGDGGDRWATGGGIWAHSLEVHQSVISRNAAEGFYSVGGGIWAAAIEIHQSVISHNSAETDVGGASGGGILAGLGVIRNSTISDNHASGATRAYGGGVRAEGEVEIYSSVITKNTATARNAYGGGVHLTDPSWIIDATIADNVVSGDKARGGGISNTFRTPTKVMNSTISGNRAEGTRASGGGVIGGGLIRIYDSMISSNQAIGTEYAKGGGINRGNVINTTVTDNTAGAPYAYGGGLYSGDVAYSTVSNNRAIGTVGLGGGILSKNFELFQATVSGNSASTAGGGIYIRGEFDRQLRACTITNNNAPAGAGLVLSDWDGTVAMELSSVIISANQNNDDIHLVGTSEFLSNGFNLVGGGNAISSIDDPTDLPGVTDPGLMPLANNGGRTRTHALLPTSPAVNTGDPKIGILAWADQRREPFVREYDGRADIGAFEFQPLPGDFDLDGDYDCEDVDMLVAFLAGGVADPNVFGDFTLEMWLSRAGEENLGVGQQYQFGDANLDGVVDGEDFIAWSSHRFSETAAWCAGDFNADGFVDGEDFIIWNENKSLVSPPIANQPPHADVVLEPVKVAPSSDHDLTPRTADLLPVKPMPLVTSTSGGHVKRLRGERDQASPTFENEIDSLFARLNSFWTDPSAAVGLS